MQRVGRIYVYLKCGLGRVVYKFDMRSGADRIKICNEVGGGSRINFTRSLGRVAYKFDMRAGADDRLVLTVGWAITIHVCTKATLPFTALYH